jgi:hypothetical protein
MVLSVPVSIARLAADKDRLSSGFISTCRMYRCLIPPYGVTFLTQCRSALLSRNCSELMVDNARVVHRMCLHSQKGSFLSVSTVTNDEAFCV